MRDLKDIVCKRYNFVVRYIFVVEALRGFKLVKAFENWSYVVVFGSFGHCRGRTFWIVDILCELLCLYISVSFVAVGVIRMCIAWAVRRYSSII